MNKLFKFPFLMAFAIALGTGFASCSDDDDTDSDHNVGGAGTVTAETFKSVLEQYVNYTVIPTYKTLADKAIILDKAVNRLNEDRSDANLAVACLAWRDARQYWELSESFLYGAAADYSIDPHIDSWPLDKTALDNLLGNNYLLDNFDAGNLGNNLLGFHGLEYILFSEGKPKGVSNITENQYKYAVGVADDLAVQCVRLEASWAGVDALSDVKTGIEIEDEDGNAFDATKEELLEANELTPTRNYGEELIAAGEQGNKNYKTSTSGIAEIIQGCFDIADEVGNSKIYTPWYKQEVLEVESWYSFNSLKDYVDNIRSIENAYLGGMADVAEFDYTSQGEGKTAAMKGNRNEALSVSACVKKLDADLDTKLKAAIANAIEKINGIPAPYRNNLDKTTEIKAAMDACNELATTLTEIKQRIEEN
ncbi:MULTISPECIES: imelysin family protein [unclassified Bacteroides]|jgi:hypothetical protein|uniref:imelysin family protein n=1 Tax=unclassified Bacteroides TaxID=2646097 RepID=UPI000E9BDF9B|nr:MULTISPECIES: imelysin family protein [unclassified Bacteroides]RGN47613.1 peptidase M75 [Bacteroides sp. OM05-12]RHR75367.1 peptidase M75 [Bacteroides sp. AF16-49]